MKHSTFYNKTNVLFVLALFFISIASIAQDVNEEMVEHIRKNHIPGDLHQYDKYINKLEFDYAQKHPELFKNKESNYDDYESFTEEAKTTAEIKVSKNEFLNVLKSANISIKQSSSSMLSSLRTAADEGEQVEIPYTKLLQSKIRQEYDVASEEFIDSQMTSYVYVDKYSTYTYEVLADAQGNLLDTVRIEYREFNPLSESQIIGQEIYEKINGTLILTLRLWREEVELKKDETITIIYIDNTYYASYQTNPETGDSYLGYESNYYQKGDTSFQHTYGYYPTGLYSSQNKDISHKTLGRISFLNENYDLDGNIVYGNKQQSIFDTNGNLLERKFEIWDLQLGSYYTNFKRVNIYDESGRLIEEVYDFAQSKNRYEYIWDQDTIISKIDSYQFQDEEFWTMGSKTAYTYKKDTTLATRFSFDGSGWVENGHIDWYIYSYDNEGNTYQVHGYGTIGEEPYNFLDTTMNSYADCQPFYKKAYQWNGQKYNLSLIEERNYDEQCNRILDLYAVNSWGMKQESFSSEGRIISSSSTSNDPDISDGIDWDIMNYFSNKSDETKPEGLYREMISYWGSGGWKFEEYANSDHNISYFAGYRLSMNAPPNEFVWYQELSYHYLYDENLKLIEVTTEKTYNEDIPLAFYSKKFYTNNEFGFETIVDGHWDGTNFTLTDSLFFSYDANGYLTEEKRFYYQEDQITSGYKILYNYPEGDLDELCAITFEGDTLLNNGSTTIVANIAGESPTYEWQNASNAILVKTAEIEITEEGTYYVSAINELCSNTDSIKIWKECDLTVEGDTIIRIGRRARVRALMEGLETDYTWKDISEKVLSNLQEIEFDREGKYLIIARNDSSGCSNTDTINIWRYRPITIFGDSLIRKGRAILKAYLDGKKGKSFNWFDERGSLLGFSNSIHATEPGLYTVELKENYIYGEASWRIGEEPFQVSDLEDDFINIYPNPTNGYINIESTELSQKSAQWQLRDLEGKMAFQGTLLSGEAYQQLNLIGLHPGIYVLKLDIGDSTTYKKILIE